MADVKITELPVANVLTKSEILPIVQSGSTVQVSVQKILDEVPVSDPVSDSVAADVATLVVDFNNLLAQLRAANIIGS